jgi:hypothetical protein
MPGSVSKNNNNNKENSRLRPMEKYEDTGIITTKSKSTSYYYEGKAQTQITNTSQSRVRSMNEHARSTSSFLMRKWQFGQK